MSWQPGALKHWLTLNDGGVWGDDPTGEGDTVVLRSTDISLGGGWDLREPAVRQLSAGERKSKRLRPGDLVVVKSSGSEAHLGKTAVVTAEVAAHEPCFANFVHRLRPGRNADARFLWYFLNSKLATDSLALSGNTSTGLRNISGGMLGDLPFSGAPVDTQRAIADFLDAETARIDSVVIARNRQRELLAARHAAAIDRVVLGLDRESAPSRALFFAAVPTNWTETTLRHLGYEVQTGPFGSQLHADEYIEEGWPVVNPMNLVDGRIEPTAHMTVSDSKRGELQRHMLSVGDIVFGRRGELGRAGFVEEDQVGWLCGTGSLRLRKRWGPLDSSYLKILLETAALRSYFKLQSVGSTMDNLNAEILLSMPCLVPPPAAQAEIVAAAHHMRDARARLDDTFQRQVALFQEHRQALITAAVTGQLDLAREIAEEAS